jgi:hypothetical protein
MVISDDMRVLLEYPAVEYIPLDVVTLARGDAPAADGWCDLLVATREEEMVGWPIPPEPVSFAGRLVLLGLGLDLTGCLYRGEKVSLLARPAPGRFHLAALSTAYFYKHEVFFIVQARDGEVLASTSKKKTPLRTSPGMVP